MYNSRWNTEKELKRYLDVRRRQGFGYSEGGPVLYAMYGRKYHYGGEGHTIFLGVSGSGKSRRGTIPMVRSFQENRESFVVVDPKGEIYRQTACYLTDKYDEKNIHVIDLRNVMESERWNPLAGPYQLFQGSPNQRQRALEQVDDLAHCLYPTPPHTDPYWTDMGRDLFIGLCYALFELKDKKNANMAGIYNLVVKDQVSRMQKELPEDSIATTLLQSYTTLQKAQTTQGCVRSTFMEGLSMFARSEGLKQMLSEDDLQINELDGETPTAIYITLPEESPIYFKLAGVLTSQLTTHYICMAQERYNGVLPRRLNVVLEELGNIGRAISNLPQLMSAGRSRNVRLQLVLQSLSQLSELYGESNATTIMSNADVMICFRTNNWSTLEELSRKCGTRTVDYGTHQSQEALITPAQLGAMQTGQCLVMVSGRLKLISWLPDLTELYDYSDWTEPPERCRRRPKEEEPAPKGPERDTGEKAAKPDVDNQQESLVKKASDAGRTEAPPKRKSVSPEERRRKVAEAQKDQALERRRRLQLREQLLGVSDQKKETTSSKESFELYLVSVGEKKKAITSLLNGITGDTAETACLLQEGGLICRCDSRTQAEQYAALLRLNGAVVIILEA